MIVNSLVQSAQPSGADNRRARALWRWDSPSDIGHLLIGTNALQSQGGRKVIVEAANKTQTAATHTYTTMKHWRQGPDRGGDLSKVMA